MLLDLAYDRPGFNTIYMNFVNARKVLESTRARLFEHIEEHCCALAEER